MRDRYKRSLPKHLCAPNSGPFYEQMILDALHSFDIRTYSQAVNELDWELLKRPYYNVFPSIVPMLTRLNLDLDSDLIRLPMTSLCIRFPKDPTKNPLKFDWNGEQLHVDSILIGDIGEGKGISLHFDLGQRQPTDWRPNGCCNLARKPGLTVEESLASLIRHEEGEKEIWLPDALLTDCLRLCCTLCLLDNDPKVISPDVIADDRAKYEATGDEKYIKRAHRKGKIGCRDRQLG
jgi:hypothetical protein